MNMTEGYKQILQEGRALKFVIGDLGLEDVVIKDDSSKYPKYGVVVDNGVAGEIIKVTEKIYNTLYDDNYDVGDEFIISYNEKGDRKYYNFSSVDKFRGSYENYEELDASVAEAPQRAPRGNGRPPRGNSGNATPARQGRNARETPRQEAATPAPRQEETPSAPTFNHKAMVGEMLAGIDAVTQMAEADFNLKLKPQEAAYIVSTINMSTLYDKSNTYTEGVWSTLRKTLGNKTALMVEKIQDYITNDLAFPLEEDEWLPVFNYALTEANPEIHSNAQALDVFNMSELQDILTYLQDGGEISGALDG